MKSKIGNWTSITIEIIIYTLLIAMIPGILLLFGNLFVAIGQGVMDFMNSKK